MPDYIGKPVPAVFAYGIYKDYDGNAPDVEPNFFTTKEHVRDHLVMVMNEAHKKGEDIWTVNGCEWAACWKAKVIVAPTDSLVDTIEDANKALDRFFTGI